MTQKVKAKNILCENDIRPSVVRLSVLDYLLCNRTHPPADEIYKALEEKIPTLSKTSVYNTLKLLVEKDIIKEIDIDAQQVRYDGCAEFHGHFKCDKCLGIYDLDIEEPKANPNGFSVKHKEVYYYGICNQCAVE